jgi:hypothetical protein
MHRMLTIGCTLAVCAFFASFVTGAAPSKLVLKNVERAVDISTQVVKEDVKITLENVGGDSQDFLTHVIETERDEKLAWFAAYVSVRLPWAIDAQMKKKVELRSELFVSLDRSQLPLSEYPNQYR